MYKATRNFRAKCTTGGGFTLAELLIVVAVIAVLVAVAIPTFGSQLEKSRQSVDLSNLRGAYAAAKMAILNQTDTDSANPLLTKGADVALVYDVDSGELKPATLDNAVPEAYRYGKATTSSVVIGTDGLPDTIAYTGTLPTAASGTDTQKGIVVSFIWDATDYKFTLGSVMFNTNVEVAGAKTTIKLKATDQNATGTKEITASADATSKNVVLTLGNLFAYEFDPSVTGVKLDTVTYAMDATNTKISNFVPSTAGVASTTDATTIAKYAALSFDNSAGTITIAKGSESGDTPAPGVYTIEGVKVTATTAYAATIIITLTVK